VFEVPLSGGGEAAFEADEEGTLVGFAEVAEFFDGAVGDVLVPGEADQGAAPEVADFVKGVVGKVFAAGAAVVELEAVFEEDFVEDGLLAVGIEADEVRGFLPSSWLCLFCSCRGR